MKGLIIAAIVLCAALIGGGIYFTLKPVAQGPRTVPISAAYADRLSTGYWSTGATNPKVTVTEYADFQCPACQVLSAPLNQAIAQFPDTVQLQFRDYPIENKHDKALFGAEAAEAAGRQGKFWQMHDLLYANQTSWESDTVLQFKDVVYGYAKQLGLDVNQFKRDVADKSINDAINKNIADGNAINLQATPTILINGTMLDEAATNAWLQGDPQPIVDYLKSKGA